MGSPGPADTQGAPFPGPKHPLVSVFPAWMARPGQVGSWSGAAPRGASPPSPRRGRTLLLSGTALGNVCVYIRKGKLPASRGRLGQTAAATGLGLLAGVTVEG